MWWKSLYSIHKYGNSVSSRLCSRPQRRKLTVFYAKMSTLGVACHGAHFVSASHQTCTGHKYRTHIVNTMGCPWTLTAEVTVVGFLVGSSTPVTASTTPVWSNQGSENIFCSVYWTLKTIYNVRMQMVKRLTCSQLLKWILHINKAILWT